MPRTKPAPEATDAEEKEGQEGQEVPVAPQPKLVAVSVKPDCPWYAIQSAGSMWSKQPSLIKPDDGRLPELRRCEWLIVEEP